MLPQCVVPTLKQGRSSVLVWGSFCFAGVGDLPKIDGIMKKEQYFGIFQENPFPSGVSLIGENFVFMHDNDPKHSKIFAKII